VLTRGQTTRARLLVTLAAFLPGRNVHLVNFDWANEIEGRRIKCSGEALDEPMDCLVCHIDFALQLSETRVEPEKGVNGEQPSTERNFRVSEDRAYLSTRRESRRLRRYQKSQISDCPPDEVWRPGVNPTTPPQSTVDSRPDIQRQSTPLSRFVYILYVWRFRSLEPMLLPSKTSNRYKVTWTRLGLPSSEIKDF